MNRFKIYHPFCLSFWSKDLYQEVGQKWKGITFLYLLLLVFVCGFFLWISMSVKIHAVISEFAEQKAPQLIEKIPEGSIKEGVVSIKAEEPYIIKDPDSGEPIVIIDTTVSLNSLKQNKTPIVITRNKLIVRKNEIETRIIDLSHIDHFSLTHQKLRRWFNLFVRWFGFILYPFLFIFSFASLLFAKLMAVLVYAVLGILFSKMLKAALNYSALLRLSIIAITPANLLAVLLWLIDFRLPFLRLFSIGISLAYLFFAVKVNAELGRQENQAEFIDSPPPGEENTDIAAE